MKKCGIPECDRKHYGHGLCAKHYKVRYRAGEINNPRLEKRIPLTDRLKKYSQLNPSTGCVEWVGAKDVCGYGKLFVNKKTVKAHRLAWELLRGPIPDGLLALHRCDNRACINPEHLFLGTDKDNALDRNAKGRNAFQGGECGPAAKLTDEIVRQIRLDGRPQGKIAADYGINQTTVSKIKLRQTWAHVS